MHIVIVAILGACLNVKLGHGPSALVFFLREMPDNRFRHLLTDPRALCYNKACSTEHHTETHLQTFSPESLNQ